MFETRIVHVTGVSTPTVITAGSTSFTMRIAGASTGTPM